MSEIASATEGGTHRTLTAIRLATALIATTLSASDAHVIEREMRRQATVLSEPAFPADALKRHISGAAVAQVRIAPDGTVDSVYVLEAPLPSIAASVINAVKKWRFVPEKKHYLVGNLYFYFIGSDGGRVLGEEAALDAGIVLSRPGSLILQRRNAAAFERKTGEKNER